ncbi:MAG: LuxR C-terminal-related transcriptional regulator [Candidatus Dormiibacterota bacterium]
MAALRRRANRVRAEPEGLTTADLADQLGIAPYTVEWHVRHLIEKLQVHSKLQAMIEAARHGLINP